AVSKSFSFLLMENIPPRAIPRLARKFIGNENSYKTVTTSEGSISPCYRFVNLFPVVCTPKTEILSGVHKTNGLFLCIMPVKSVVFWM
ncbi:MAG: hypothetical protein IKU55_04230, partial [Clostridia bacterium]|nr:hypothetical protein [Clostridia bacterium]